MALLFAGSALVPFGATTSNTLRAYLFFSALAGTAIGRTIRTTQEMPLAGWKTATLLVCIGTTMLIALAFYIYILYPHNATHPQSWVERWRELLIRFPFAMNLIAAAIAVCITLPFAIAIPADTSISAAPPPHRVVSLNWCVQTAIIATICGTITFLLVWFEHPGVRLGFVVAVSVFLWLLPLNPAFFAQRAMLLLLFLCGQRSFGVFLFAENTPWGRIEIGTRDSVDWSFYLAVCILAIVLFFFQGKATTQRPMDAPQPPGSQ